MGHLPLASFRRGTALVAIAVLVVCGATACGLGGPSPAAHRPDVDVGASGTDGGSELALDGQLMRIAAKPIVKAPDPFHLVLRLGERRLYLLDDDPGTPVESFPIAIGREGLETPTGQFEVEEMIVDPDFLVIDKKDRTRVVKRIPPGPTNPLGVRWIGFAHGEGWTVGIHGTPNPELLGRAVSHGCVRMRNADVIHVFDRIQLGTPVIVVP